MAISPLSDIQKQRVKRLEKSLIRSTRSGDLNGSRAIIADLKPILLGTGNSARYYLANLRYLEATMNFGDIHIALQGIKNIQSRANSNTRVFLEASSLLAICFLRLGNFDEAEPIIKEVLENDKVIRSDVKRAEFRKEAISRFDEEALMYGLSEERPSKLSVEEIEEVIVNNIGRSEEDLYENIGMIVPESAKHILSRIDSFSKKQLPTAERLALPSGKEVVNNKKIGRRVQKFVSRILYNSFCDKESETYKSLISGTLASTTSLITVSITDIFNKFSIGKTVLVGLIAANIIRLGIDFICSVSKPKNLIDYR